MRRMKNIGIIGIGLIGSSLARDFLASGDTSLHIYDASPEHMDTARELNLGHHYHHSAADLAELCDIIFICVPVRRIAQVVADIAPHLRYGTILSDVGSVKAPVFKAVQDINLPDGVHFVPGHPAAGLEYYGPTAGKTGLFHGKTYALTPDDHTDRAAVSTIRSLIETNTGARVLELDAQTHDRIFAYTSHMPHILAFAAMNATSRAGAAAGENVLPYAGTTYRDWTRVARSDAVMWRDIFLTNTDAIRASLDLYLDEIQHLMDMIAHRDEAGITAYINISGQLRADMDQKYGGPGPSQPTPLPDTDKN